MNSKRRTPQSFLSLDEQAELETLDAMILSHKRFTAEASAERKTLLNRGYCRRLYAEGKPQPHPQPPAPSPS